MAPVLIKRPILSIQPDWEEVFREKVGTVWVSCKEYLKDGQHGKLNFTLSAGDSPHVRATDGFKVENILKNTVTILHQDPNCKCTFIAAKKKFASVHSKSIVSIDTTTNGLGVSVCSDNHLRVWDSSNGSVLRNLEGHVWDVYTCRFFPSGSVIFSAGTDMQIKIWSAETGNCPVTLLGHTAAITDVSVVNRGRNIVSVSKDGSVRLWDCGQSSCLDVVIADAGPINCCAVGDASIDLKQPDNPPSEREVDTEGKLLLLGSEDNCFQGIGLQSRKSIFVFTNDCAVNCCCFLSPSKAIFGAQNGKIHLFDLSNPSEPSITWEESASAVLCMIPTKNGFFVGRADGTSTYIPLDGDLTFQLTGPDFDPVYCISFDGSCIFTGSRDGLVRKYSLPNSSGISLS